MEDHLIDKRTVERNIRRGRLERSQYEKMLDSLPDRSENVDVSEPEDASGEGDSDADRG
ncbi:MAG: hypothetical protein PVI30_02300 [Myxococcales bacterium]|jgi:hypothetical protein